MLVRLLRALVRLLRVLGRLLRGNRWIIHWSEGGEGAAAARTDWWGCKTVSVTDDRSGRCTSR